MVPPRIRAAAVLLGLFGIGLIAYTVMLTAPLLGNPDPMIGLELIVSAILVCRWYGSRTSRRKPGYPAAGSWR
jgi:hypothetical protein